MNETKTKKKSHSCLPPVEGARRGLLPRVTYMIRLRLAHDRWKQNIGQTETARKVWCSDWFSNKKDKPFLLALYIWLIACHVAKIQTILSHYYILLFFESTIPYPFVVYHTSPIQFGSEWVWRVRSENQMAKEGEVVCVTGGSGCIGSWLVRELLDRGYTVHATVQDLSYFSICNLLVHFIYRNAIISHLLLAQ